MFNGDCFGDDRPKVEEDFGPWMMVKRQPRWVGSSRSSGTETVDRVPPVSSIVNGKSANIFNVLSDLGESADLEGSAKVTPDNTKRHADSMGDKENIPIPQDNIT
ncbi:hypothetical protein LINPERHAP1_LOCUS8721 [Linum perenne]